MSCKQVFRWIWVFIILENARGIHDKFWAICHKIFLIAACHRFLVSKTKDVGESLTHDRHTKNVWHITIPYDRLWVLLLCLFIYIVFLGVVYTLIRWERLVARKKRLARPQWKQWKSANILKRLLAYIVKFILFPVGWPFLCAYIGSKVHRFSSLLIFALLGCAYLAFMFRHRRDDDYGMIDTVTAVEASIFYLCDADHCRKEWYLAVLTVLLPTIVKRVVPLVLKRFWRRGEEERFNQEQQGSIRGGRSPPMRVD